MKNSLILLSLTVISFFLYGELKAQTKQDTLIREYYKAFDAGDFDKMMSYFSNDAQISISFTPGLMDVVTYKDMAMDFKNGFPDIRHTIIKSFESKKDYAFKASMAGTNTGVTNGNPPTGNKIDTPFVGLVRFNSDWKITHMTIHMDTKAYYDQLTKKE